MPALVTTRPTNPTIMSIAQQQFDRQAPVRSYGISRPISLDFPSPSDLSATRNLDETLRSYDYFESDAELAHRIDVLTKLNRLVRSWIRDVSLAKHFPRDFIDNVGGSLLTFGSYRLGVHAKGGDIDTLVIAPRHLSRSDFFTSFVELLRRQVEVCDLRAIEGAFAPVIKFTFDGIEFDMLFARLALPTIPETLDLKDDQLLRNLDARCVRSLNGCRVADEILDLVPNHETFKSTLRAIKLWAKKWGLDSNALGFFGGVTWALLVARICQLYPNAAVATLVQKFFLVYSQWNWPTPVLLRSVDEVQSGFPVWDPTKNLHDLQHLMPVITPAFPQQNSTHNVTKSTQKLIVREIARALTIVNNILASRADWKELFIGIPFFDRYKHYILLLLSAPDQNRFVEWSGLFEAKIRLLVGNLERNPRIDIAHASAEMYTPHESVFDQSQSTSDGDSTQASSSSPSRSPKTVTKFNGMWLVGLQFQNARGALDLSAEIRDFIYRVRQAAAQVNMNGENINLDARYIRGRDLHTVIPGHAMSPSHPPNTSTAERANGTDGKRSPSDSPDTDEEPRRKRVKIGEAGDQAQDSPPLTSDRVVD